LRGASGWLWPALACWVAVFFLIPLWMVAPPSTCSRTLANLPGPPPAPPKTRCNDKEPTETRHWDIRAGWRFAVVAVVTVSLSGAVLCAAASLAPSAQGQAGIPVLLATGKELVLRLSDLPRGWTSDGSAGPCMQGGGSDSSAPDCGNTPMLRQQASDDKFTHCLGLPVSHVSMLTWQDEPGEPFTYVSSTFTAPGYSSLYQTPTLASAVTIEPSVALQERDLAAFSRPSFPKCFKIQEVWQMWAIAEQLGPTKHLSMAFGPMCRIPEKVAKGVTAISYAVSFTLKSPKRDLSALFAWVIFGAGHVEEVLKATSTLVTPMPAAAVTTAFGHLEDRLLAYTAS